MYSALSGRPRRSRPEPAFRWVSCTRECALADPRLGRLESDLAEIEEEASALSARWQAEKSRLQGSQKIKEELDKARTELELAQPYKLEPVRELKDFVGRSAAIRDLVRVVLQSGNARIEGERRVGKTSLANAVDAAVADHAGRSVDV